MSDEQPISKAALRQASGWPNVAQAAAERAQTPAVAEPEDAPKRRGRPPKIDIQAQADANDDGDI